MLLLAIQLKPGEPPEGAAGTKGSPCIKVHQGGAGAEILFSASFWRLATQVGKAVENMLSNSRGRKRERALEAKMAASPTQYCPGNVIAQHGTAISPWPQGPCGSL